jgi:S-adenosylmethionine synthetase
MILVNALEAQPLEEQPLELVERKGLGHPDTITDNVVDAISVALNKEFLRRWNGILHYNLDKGFLAAGSSRPMFGGGSVEKPMLLILGDRATVGIGDDTIDLDSLVRRVTRDWVRHNLRFVDPDKHLRIQNEIGKSAGNLADIFGRGGEFLGANDTSAAVGYAPATRTETLVKAVEQYVNSPEFKRDHPEAGEDVKVMGRRVKADFDLTLSIAFVDRFIRDEADYFRKKEEIRSAIEAFARERLGQDSISVTLNNLDKPGRGVDGTYLTVTGTSAESGDSGQVGRGNRVNGLFSPCRPSSSEAASGKNPVSHIGKIYNVMAFQVADAIVSKVDGVREAYFWLLSRIGEPVNSPRLAAAQVITAHGSNQDETSRAVREVVEESLTPVAFKSLMDKLIKGEVTLC